MAGILRSELTEIPPGQRDYFVNVLCVDDVQGQLSPAPPGPVRVREGSATCDEFTPRRTAGAGRTPEMQYVGEVRYLEVRFDGDI